MKIRKIYGLKVFTSDKQDIGEIDGVHADVKNWRITKLDISLNRETEELLGLWKPRLTSLTICLPVSYVKDFGKTILLTQTLMDLKSLKECK